ncbi:MAG: HAMP domain-containing histidine kinase [Phycisphaerales bacterium]|nr:MAG: HAMP domain-containing histidine kinase [Phycisphaerales bacterium]
MTIRSRLYLIFAAMLVITLAASAQSWRTLGAYDRFNNRARDLARSALEAEKVLSLAYRQSDMVRFAPVGEDTDEVNRFEARVNDLLDTLHDKASDTGAKDKIELIRDLRHAYEDLVDLLFQEVNRRAAGQVLDEPSAEPWYAAHRTALENVRALADKLVRQYEGELLAQITAAQGTGFYALITITIASLLTVLVLTILLLVVGRWLLTPLEHMAAAAERIGSGDLEHRLTQLSRDEIGALGRSLNEMASKLQSHQQRLLEARELAIIGAMSSSVAHGLRNPLAGIRVAAQLMASALPQQDPSCERVHDIIDEVDRMTRRITDLLEFGKPTELRPETVYLRELIAQGIREAQATLDHHGIIVTVDNSTDNLAVNVDRDRIVQTVAELLTNAAVHAGDSAPVTISARILETSAYEPDLVELIIEDRGKGTDAATIEHAFDLFFTTRQGGSGMGLPAAKRIVELHGGHLTLRSESGRGTTVALSLPRAVAPGIP